jgi:hypothetical protein
MTTQRGKWRNYSASDSQLVRMHALFTSGQLTKVEIERKFFKDWTSNGQGITYAWLHRCGIDTRKEHPMAAENRRLRGLLVQFACPQDIIDGERELRYIYKRAIDGSHVPTGALAHIEPEQWEIDQLKETQLDAAYADGCVAGL